MSRRTTVTERVGGQWVGDGGEEYRWVWTLATAVVRRVEAVTEVRNLVAPGWDRERISRRRIGAWWVVGVD
jgi:hypothetical protein